MQTATLSRPIHSNLQNRPKALALGFGSNDCEPSEQIRRALKEFLPSAADFLAGKIPLQGQDGKSVQARILPALPEDYVQVDDWYNQKPAGEPNYHGNQKWREWWRERIQTQTTGFKVLKLVIGENKILGVVELAKRLGDAADKALTSWIEGIRIDPRCNAMMTEKADFKGVGAALVTHAVVESLNDKTEGLGLNSTLGAEGFYRKMGMAPRPATDGIRTCFTVKGHTERLKFLMERFQRYAALLSTKAETSSDPASRKPEN